MRTPERTAEGFPVIALEQATRDTGQTAEEVARALSAAFVRLERGEVTEAAEAIDSALSALSWLADRLAITEGGPLKRRLG